jgi:WhiB family transcriptional regulator, redox-sensing transcriptional regulator
MKAMSLDVDWQGSDWQKREWRRQGACAGAEPDLFFPISATAAAAPQVARAKAICADCPVRSACLGFAMAHRDLSGIWGGTTDEERRKTRRSRTRSASRVARAGRAA